MQLTVNDYNALACCYITPAPADAAGLYRVDSLEGRDRVGRKGGGDYAGIKEDRAAGSLTEVSFSMSITLFNSAGSVASGVRQRNWA